MQSVPGLLEPGVVVVADDGPEEGERCAVAAATSARTADWMACKIASMEGAVSAVFAPFEEVPEGPASSWSVIGGPGDRMKR